MVCYAQARTHTCVLSDVFQEQRILGEPLHLDGNDVLQLQPPTLRLALRLLSSPRQPFSLTPKMAVSRRAREREREPYLDEGIEASLLLLPAFDLVQGPRLVTAEAGRQLLEPFPFRALKLKCTPKKIKLYIIYII